MELEDSKMVHMLTKSTSIQVDNQIGIDGLHQIWITSGFMLLETK